MNKSTVTDLFKSISKWTSKHSPELLTGAGIAAGVTTVVLAVKATPKALQLIEEEKHNQKTDHLKPVDTVKATWKCYIPAALTGTASMACIIGANSVNTRRHAALAAAYELSTTALKEYRGKVVETIGEKKEKTVREKLSQQQVEREPIVDREVIVTKKGDTLFFEPLSGRYFKSDIDTIKSTVNELNRRMIGGENYISLSEFYQEIGLAITDISDDLGWRVDNSIIEIEYNAVKADDGTPCLSLDFLVKPEYDYYNMY